MLKDIVALKTEKMDELSKAFKDMNDIDRLQAFISELNFSLPNFSLKAIDMPLSYAIDFEWNEYKKELAISVAGLTYATLYNFGIDTNVLSSNYCGIVCDYKYHFKTKEKKENLIRQLRAKYGEDYTFNDFFGSQLIVYVMIQMVLVAKPELVKKEQRKVEKTISVKKHGRTTYKSVVYIKDYYTMSDKKLTKKDIHHIIKCPAWGVRGHKRHLSNGTIVFVKPYVKGKFRNDGMKYVVKTYKT